MNCRTNSVTSDLDPLNPLLNQSINLASNHSSAIISPPSRRRRQSIERFEAALKQTLKNIDDRFHSLIHESIKQSSQISSSHLKSDLLALIMNTLHLHSNHSIRNRSQQSINQSINHSLNQSLTRSRLALESEADLIAELEEFYGHDGDDTTSQSMSDSDYDGSELSDHSIELSNHQSSHKRKLESVDSSNGSIPYTHQVMASSNNQTINPSTLEHSTTSTRSSSDQSNDESINQDSNESDEDSDTIDTSSMSFLSPSISCGICGLFMYRPVTPIECGHSFCQACLSGHINQQTSINQSNNQSLHRCPVESCGVEFSSDSARSVCVQLSGTLERCFPREHAIAKLHSEALNAISVGSDDAAVRLLGESIKQWPDCFSLYATRLCANLRLCQFDASLTDLRSCMTLAQNESPSPVSHPYHRSDATLNTLSQLGQAGLFTRIYRLSIYAFASALSLSHQTDTRIDREMIANKLVDAYMAEARKHAAPIVRPLINQSTSRSLRPSTSTSLMSSTPSTSTSLMSSSRSLIPTSRSLLPTSSQSLLPTPVTNNQTNNQSITQPVSSSPSQTSPPTSSSPSPPIFPPLSTFLLDVAASDYPSVVRSSVTCQPVKAARSADTSSSLYRQLVDHPLPSAVNSELQCLLCMDLLFQPVTVRCGHTFCNTCLARSLDHKNLCPFCRDSLSVHISPQRQPVNQAIKSILERWCPRAYSQRAAAIAAELEEQSLYIPLFVCTLMFPGVSCPLHIFEPRYRLMIRSVLESGYNRFGMVVQIDKDGAYSSVGCTAEIRSVRLLPDGRSLVDTVGGRRFLIKEKGCRNGYDVAKIEYLEDLTREEQDEMFAESTPSLDELQDQVRTLVEETLLPRMLNSFDIESQLGPMPSSDDTVLYAYWLCAVLPMRLDDKFEFLQFRSDYERFFKLQATLTELQDKEWC